MATLKPIGTDKKKAPLYFEDTVQIYGPIPRNAKAPFNPQDAQKGLKKLLEGKKSIKAKMVAGETGLGLKKKGIGGKKPPMEKMPYTGVKGFYQFSDNPGCVVVAVETKEIKPQYVIFAPTTVEKAVRLVKVFQAAQWAEKSNLKNKPAPLPEIDNSAAVASSRRSSEVLSRRSPTDVKSAATRESRSSSTSSRSSRRTAETPNELQRKSRSVSSSSSSSRRSRTSSVEKTEQVYAKEQTARSPTPRASRTAASRTAASRSPSASSRRSFKSTTSISTPVAPSVSPLQSRRSPVSKKSKTASRRSSRSLSFSSSSSSRERVSSRACFTPEPEPEPQPRPAPEPKREPKPSEPTCARKDSECHFVAFDNPKSTKKYRSSSSSSSSSDSDAYGGPELPNGGVYLLASHKHKNITKGAAALTPAHKSRHSERSTIFLYRAESSSDNDSSSDSENEHFRRFQPFADQSQLQPRRLRHVSTSSSSSSSSDSDSSDHRSFFSGMSRRRV